MVNSIGAEVKCQGKGGVGWGGDGGIFAFRAKGLQGHPKWYLLCFWCLKNAKGTWIQV